MKQTKLLLISALFGLSGAANAAVISYSLDAEFSGATASSGPVLVTFDDGGTAGSVTMTVDTVNLTSPEHLKNLYLNIDSAIGPFGLGGSLNGGSGWTTFGLTKDPDKTDTTDGTNLKADGAGGYFDMRFDFSAPGINGMTPGSQFIYDFTGPASLVASSFTAHSHNGFGVYSPFEIAAHIGGTGSSGQDSGWMTDSRAVPLPGTLLLFGVGLLAAARVSKR